MAIDRNKEYMVFLSVPMLDRSERDVKLEIEKIKEQVMTGFKNVTFIDSFIEDDNPDNLTKDNIGIWYLGQSLIHLAKANLAVFAPNWNKARGCRIEELVANQYNIECIYL